MRINKAIHIYNNIQRMAISSMKLFLLITLSSASYLHSSFDGMQVNASIVLCIILL